MLASGMDSSFKGSYQTCPLCVSYTVIIILNRFQGRCSHGDFGGPLDNDRFSLVTGGPLDKDHVPSLPIRLSEAAFLLP